MGARSLGAAGRRRFLWSDRVVGPVLAATGCLVLLLIAGLVAYVVDRAWPSFEANGLGWFGSGGNVNLQLEDIYTSKRPFEYLLRAWPLVYGTALAAGGAVVIGVAISVPAAVFVAVFAPARTRRVVEPMIRLLAGVPSVIYGLIGILVLVPFVGEQLISQERKESVFYVVQLSGASLLVATAILTVMIVPIMVAIVVDALEAVPRTWTEGALALGANRWRATWTIAVRVTRPAIVAAAVLSLARALGEAIMLAMVSGGVAFAPNPARRRDLRVRAGAAAGGRDRAERRGRERGAVRPHAVRVRRGHPRVERDALVHGLGGAPAAAPVPAGSRDGGPHRSRRGQPRGGRSPTAPRSRCAGRSASAWR